uniref:Uncharacterized protein n=1 Tax=Trepomonas sp. PC1 TaxID=1076344 RepID=A0A146K7T3_9EUKA|eukprot:JAP92438.1 Hypothetical protein TPC1_15623 [Trepomonas sp. PC1]
MPLVLDKQQFSDALRLFLGQQNMDQANTDRQIFDQIESMSKVEKRGIWDVVAAALKTKAKIAKDFYHNTWNRQFYDKLSNTNDQLQKLMKENPQNSNKNIIDLFVARNRGCYCRRQISQLMYRIRKSQKPTNDGFQVDVQQCVVFQDILDGM